MHVEFQWAEERYDELVQGCAQNPMIPFITKYMPRDLPILEAGCGLGHIVKYLAGQSYQVSGIEVGESAVSLANRVSPELPIILGTIENMPYPENNFNGIMCFGVVEHVVEGPSAALKELHRVLSPGSYALISVPVFNRVRAFKHYTGLALLDHYLRKLLHRMKGINTNSWHASGITNQRREYHRWPAAGDFFEYRYTKNEISNFIREAGFLIEDELALEGLGGLYHELGGKVVNLRNPSRFVRMLDGVMSRFPFMHHHTYLAIAKKSQ